MEYSLDPPDIPASVKDASAYLDFFLSESRRGYCSYYASAFVLLAREQVLPARYVQGYRVSTIGKRAFYECSRLCRVMLPPTLNSILDEAFGFCSNLKSINLPDSLNHLGKGVFESTPALKELVLPNGLASIPEGMCYYSGVGRVTLPKGITEIPSGCFYDCRNLTRIVLPKSVQKVARDAFYYCENLTKVVAPVTIDHVVLFDGSAESELKTVRR